MKKSANRRKAKAALCMTLMGGLAVSCAKKSETTEDTSSTSTTAVGGSGGTTSTSTSSSSTNQLSLGVPSSLVLNLMPQTTSTALWQDEAGDYSMNLADTETEVAKVSIKKEKENDKALINGSGDSCLPTFAKAPYKVPNSETCYEFDQDMIYGQNTMNSQTKVQGTKNGKNAAGEACLVAFARNKVLNAKDQLDRAKGLLFSAICQYGKEQKDAGKSAADLLPKEVGDKIDMTSALKNAFAKASKGITPSSVTMTRLADVNSQKVYQSVLTVSDAEGNERSMTINHSPKDENNNEYAGSLYYAVTPPKGQAVGGGDADKKFYISIGYARAAETDASYTNSYEVRLAHMNTDLDSKAIKDGAVDFNAGADFSVASTDNNYGAYKKADGTYFQQANQAVSGMTYITFSENETSGEQKMAYWQNPGGNYKENARGMIFSVKPDSTGAMAGCANSGSADNNTLGGLSIRRYLNEGSTNANITLTPRGFYHPFLNTENGGGGGGQGCSPSISSSGTGEFKYAKESCPGQSSNMKSEWAALSATGSNPDLFVTAQMGSLFSSQCFKQNATSGLYEIDTEKTASADGYELIQTSDSAKIIAPPSMTAVKKFDPSKVK